MNMGGVRRMDPSPRVNLSESGENGRSAAAQTGLEPAEFPSEWEDEAHLSAFSEGLEQKTAFAPSAAPQKKVRHTGAEQPEFGSLAEQLEKVKVRAAEPERVSENDGHEREQEDKMLREYLASVGLGKRSGRPVKNNEPAANEVSSLQAALQNEVEEDDFALAMREVAPLSGKGRAVIPEPVPSGQPILPVNPLQDFMDGKVEFSLEYTEEFISGHVLGLDPAVMGKLKAGSFSCEAHLDLHGLNSMQAFESLVAFIKRSYMTGKRTVLIIPGRGKNSPDGTGILRDKLQEWLTQDPFKRVVLAFATALPKHGGPGAVYVLLRKLKKSRGKIRWEHIPKDPDLFI
ncbi:MAG: Smr/MutS family protein [Desulfovibrionaceae bacterium]|nr:Smr/MutS family protein [Desulfovibrionaceae bacterium]